MECLEKATQKTWEYVKYNGKNWRDIFLLNPNLFDQDPRKSTIVKMGNFLFFQTKIGKTSTIEEGDYILASQDRYLHIKGRDFKENYALENQTQKLNNLN